MKDRQTIRPCPHVGPVAKVRIGQRELRCDMCSVGVFDDKLQIEVVPLDGRGSAGHGCSYEEH